MTEAQWLACTNLQKMLDFLRGNVSDRKLRLFAVACFQKRRSLLQPDNPCLKCLEVAEQYADGLVYREAISEAEAALGSTRRRPAYAAIATAFGVANLDADSIQTASTAARSALNIAGRAPGKSSSKASRAAARKIEKANQPDLLREIVGNPFHTTAFSSGWQTGAVREIATQMYDSRDFGEMHALAEDLQSVGCDNTAVLDHCRSSAPHVRGCWVVDLVLGKD